MIYYDKVEIDPDTLTLEDGQKSEDNFYDLSSIDEGFLTKVLTKK